MQRIGAVALDVKTVPEAVRRRVIEDRLPSHDWPQRALRITAIITATGEFGGFRRCIRGIARRRGGGQLRGAGAAGDDRPGGDIWTAG
ncbi:hypothetical protein [Mycobacterium tilburgii]|uniref:hypothetical protein n=1 Tax=Mycobacterium tilburgii TaxID=44467 RepID=UPI0038993604